MNIFFDLETAPLPEHILRQNMPAFEAPGTYKDPVKIAAAIAEKEAAFVERAALDPMTGEIVAIGYLDDNSAIILDAVESGGKDEAKLLKNFWDHFYANSSLSHKFVGWNIFRFDLPYLIRRSWIHGITVPSNLRRGRYFNGDLFTDLMEEWTLGMPGEYASLKRVANALNLGDKNEANSKDFGKLLLNNRQEALDHLKNDLELTRAIGHRLLGGRPVRRGEGAV